MRKLAIAFSLAIGCLAMNAQQALWHSRAVASPEINADNTVTFRLFAPQAGEVVVTGDFLPQQTVSAPQGEFKIPGTATMTMDSLGVWSFTTPEPLSSELYSYNLIVDGLKINDPSNVFRIRDISSITDVFLIPGGRADNYAVHDVPHGSVSKVWYYSPTIGINRRMTIYTPAGYEQNPDRCYPVFYLLHGAGGDENAWSELGRATVILDNMIASGDVEPMIVVMTNGNSGRQAAPGEGSDGFVQPNISMLRSMNGSFETHFPEVVEFVDGNYRTIADKEHRAIAGLSMGGFHSFHISKQFPDMFDFIGLFSAAIFPNESEKSPIYSDLETKLAVQFSKNPNLYYIAIGKDDFLYQQNEALRKLLDEKGYTYEYLETSDGHIWRNWRIYLTDFLPKLFK